MASQTPRSRLAKPPPAQPTYRQQQINRIKSFIAMVKNRVILGIINMLRRLTKQSDRQRLDLHLIRNELPNSFFDSEVNFAFAGIKNDLLSWVHRHLEFPNNKQDNAALFRTVYHQLGLSQPISDLMLPLINFSQELPRTVLHAWIVSYLFQRISPICKDTILPSHIAKLYYDLYFTNTANAELLGQFRAFLGVMYEHSCGANNADFVQKPIQCRDEIIHTLGPLLREDRAEAGRDLLKILHKVADFSLRLFFQVDEMKVDWPVTSQPLLFPAIFRGDHKICKHEEMVMIDRQVRTPEGTPLLAQLRSQGPSQNHERPKSGGRSRRSSSSPSPCKSTGCDVRR